MVPSRSGWPCSSSGQGRQHALLGPAEVRGRYGVDPSQVPDLIALRGDPSDGLPGAPGVGAKTAAELLRTYGSLEAALDVAANAHMRGTVGRMRPRVAQALSENDALLRTFKEIATLQPIDVALPPDRATDHTAGAAAARALGMPRLAERLERLAQRLERVGAAAVPGPGRRSNP